ncbi:Mixed type I polyketide synthase-non ribosomal peptide synthetase [Modestobacter italicus]|uniref:Mixed type I polyketide synthase-non ribosomal peptide synthetase n=1 Tax=Modestobacter italicus (strain DSM 44449 / CECT 9708 / BC 501) TaxID=2732864 RepID=I4ER45_MODI5|nr:non-ribosomal peptide synthetase [Modestobacter marinus]CCH85858.1 Mixed type I polyketide synthase-non ribosomal peptide synthetase [Modestobacter marinus]
MSVLPKTDGAPPSDAESGVPPLEVPGPHRNVLDRLAELARAVPDQLAVSGEDEQLTYAELHQRVLLLRAELTALVPADPAARRPIGLMAEQNAATVAAYLAVVTSGAPCVILDVVLPAPRLAQIVELAGATAVLADEERRAAAAALPGITEVRGLLPTTTTAETPGHELGLADPATIIYTSGTTGVPKGVVYSQQTALACACTGAAGWLLRPRDRIALIVPTAYAGGQILIFTALLNGATVLVRDPRLHGAADLARWVVASRLETMLSSPALLRALDAALPVGEVLSTVRVVVTSAEKLYGRDVTSFRRHLRPDATFVNVMGTSETDSISTFQVRGGDPAPEGALPAGSPVPLREYEVLDEADQPVPPGEVGLLAVTSATISVGYWRNPEATAQRYQRLPDGRTRYRTGDRARVDADGVLDVLGRADDAVKIRGYLVEPGEVETALRALPDVRTAVVRALPGADGLPRLVAWVVPQDGRPAPTPAGLRAAVSRTLPDWMVPRDVVLLPELPMTERGKVDVPALPPVPDRPELQRAATRDEVVLDEIWSAILELDEVGRDEGFTALGGDSLAVEEMLAEVHEHFGVSLTAADLTAHPTLQEFAALLSPDARAGREARPGVLGRLRKRLLTR